MTEKDEAAYALRKLLKRGATVYSILRHCSNSGMTRRIDFYTIKANKMVFLTGCICKLLGYRHAYKKSGGGLEIGGCGMDMGFSVVYDTSRIFSKATTNAPTRIAATFLTMNGFNFAKF